MRIRWEDFDSDGYEDMVSVLLSRLYPDSQRIDGKGGDGGRDVQIVGPGERQIVQAFELKSFTGRMTPSRRQQVKRSLKRAANLKPLSWILVVPIDPTQKELKWFSYLKQEYNFELIWRGKTWLDEKMSIFPDIHRYFVENAADEAFQLLTQLREEESVVTAAPTALKRLQKLRQRLNEIDPYFRYELSTEASAWDSRPAGIIMSVTVKNMRVNIYEKYVDALKDRPITASVNLKFGPGDEVLRESIQSAVDYGYPVTIPSDAITSFTVNAPAGLGGNFTGMELTIGSSIGDLDKLFKIALNVMKGDKILSRWPAEITQVQTGLNGVVVKGCDETGWLHIQITANFKERRMNCRLRLMPKPILPTTILPLLRWLRALESSPHLTIILPDGVTISGNGPPLPKGEHGLKIVEALAYLQEKSNVYFPMPLELSIERKTAILDYATLLQQNCSDFTWSPFTLTLYRWEPSLDRLANEAPVEVSWVRCETLELDEGSIPVGRIRYNLESARVADPERMMREFEGETAMEVKIIPGHSNKGQRIVVP